MAFGAGTVMGPSLVPQLAQWVKIDLPPIGDTAQPGSSFSSSAQNTTNIRVTGSSEIKVKPDVATLSVGVTETAPEPKRPSRRPAKKSTPS